PIVADFRSRHIAFKGNPRSRNDGGGCDGSRCRFRAFFGVKIETEEIMSRDRTHDQRPHSSTPGERGVKRRDLLIGSSLVAASALGARGLTQTAQAQQQPAPTSGRKPNILFIMGDDIGWYNVSAYNMGLMGYRTPNIDRIGREGAVFTDWYGQQSCTAGRAAFITGQTPVRTGLTKV